MKLTERDWRSMDLPEALHFGTHLIAPILLFVAGVLVVAAVLESTPQNCLYVDHPLPALHIVLVGIGAMFLGHRLSGWGPRREYAPERVRRKWDPIVVYFMWTAVFLVLALIWFYEAMGTARVAVDAVSGVYYEPITYYIRCAAYQDFAHNGIGLFSMLVVMLTSGLIGHWLLSNPPSGVRRSRRPEGS